MCMQGMGDLFYYAVGIGILFLPVTVLVGLGWGALVAGEVTTRAASTKHKELTQALLRHGLYRFRVVVV